MKLNVNGFARAVFGAGALAAALSLASCGGGGGDQVETFHADRVIAFGDEFSVINADGSKYSVNAPASDNASQLDCNQNPIWIQIVAAAYGQEFAQCPGISSTEPTGQIYAANGAKVADLSGQIDAFLNAGGGFSDKDLVTVLVGANDVIAQYQQYNELGEAQLAQNLAEAGAALAQQVNRLAGDGAKVLIVTIPDMGLAPFAGDRSPESTEGGPKVLSRLSTKFNDALMSNLLNDGRKIGLVQLDQYLTAVDTATIKGYSSAIFSNTTLPACAVALPKCSTNTLVPDAVNAAWLWADDRHFGARAHESLGALARRRAGNNPF